jgi:hypothetical protein
MRSLAKDRPKQFFFRFQVLDQQYWQISILSLQWRATAPQLVLTTSWGLESSWVGGSVGSARRSNMARSAFLAKSR